MRYAVVIEDIEEMRRREGIDDVELRKEIRALQVGDFVKLTLLAGAAPSPGETLRVRITRISGDEFRGKLASRTAANGPLNLPAGSRVAFTSAHIHSVLKRSPVHEH
jgi:hypothetical protein